MALTWNDAGNLTAWGTTTYEWTYGNRLFRVLKPGSTTEYAYDGQDRRTVVIEDGVMTRTLWSGSDEVGEYDAAGGRKRRFIPDGSGSMKAGPPIRFTSGHLISLRQTGGSAMLSHDRSRRQ